MNNPLSRNVNALLVTVVLSVCAALVGWMSWYGAGIVIAFLFFPPLIALLATKREILFGVFFVVFSWGIFVLGTNHWDLPGRDWLQDTTGFGAESQAELLGMGLVLSLIGTVPVYLSRKHTVQYKTFISGLNVFSGGAPVRVNGYVALAFSISGLLSIGHLGAISWLLLSYGFIGGLLNRDSWPGRTAVFVGPLVACGYLVYIAIRYSTPI